MSEPFPFVRSGLVYLVPYGIIKKTEGPTSQESPLEGKTDAGHEGTRLCGLRDAAQPLGCERRARAQSRPTRPGWLTRWRWWVGPVGVILTKLE